MVLTSLFAVKWRDHTCPVRNMSLKYASNNPVHALANVMVLVQLGNLDVYVHFGIMNNLAVPLLDVTSFIGRFV